MQGNAAPQQPNSSNSPSLLEAQNIPKERYCAGKVKHGSQDHQDRYPLIFPLSVESWRFPSSEAQSSALHLVSPGRPVGNEILTNLHNLYPRPTDVQNQAQRDK